MKRSNEAEDKIISESEIEHIKKIFKHALETDEDYLKIAELTDEYELYTLSDRQKENSEME